LCNAYHSAILVEAVCNLDTTTQDGHHHRRHVHLQNTTISMIIYL